MKFLLHQIPCCVLWVLVTCLSSNHLLAQWQPIPISEPSINLNFLDFYDENNGVVGGFTRNYFRTTDGGANWENFDLANFNFTFTAFDVAYREGVIILAGFKSSPRSPQLLRSIDNGQSWTSVYLGEGTIFANEPNFMRKITFLTATEVIAIGDDGAILKSTDAGETWEDTFDNVTLNLIDLSFADENLGYVVGENQLLTTTDGGENWTSQTIEGLARIDNVAAVKGTDWVYVSDGYQVYLSKDSGQNWAPTYTSSGFYKERLHAIGENQPIVSNGDAIYTSDTQGKYWERQQFPPDIILINFQFINTEVGYCVGNAGVVFKTQNRGGEGYPQAVTTNNAAFETCPNETVAFENLSDPTLDFKWLVNGIVADDLTASTVNLSFDTAGTQRVGLIVDNGFLQDTAYSAVNILTTKQPEPVDFRVSKTKICLNESVLVEVLDAPRGQTYQVLWGGVQVGGIQEGKDRTLNWTVRGILNNTTIELVVVKEQICETTGVTYSQAIEVESNNNPNVFGSTSQAVYCPSDSITLTIHNSIEDFEYEIKIDSLYSRSKQTGRVELFQNYEVGKKVGNGQDLHFTYYLADLPYFEYLRGNKHSIFVTNSLGCSGRLPFKIESIVDTTSANFQISSDFIFANESLIINTLTPVGNKFQWDFGNNSTPTTSTEQSPQIQYSKVGYDEKIQLITESENGCRDTLVKPVFIHQKTAKTSGNHCDIDERFIQNHLLTDQVRYTVLDATTDAFGNTVVCGAFTDGPANVPRLRLFVIKFDKAGKVLWEKTEQPTPTLAVLGSMCGAVTTDADGNIYLGGSFTGSNFFFKIDDFQFPREQDVNTGSNGKKCFVLKLDPAGNILWAINSYQINGGNAISDITDIIVTPSNQILIACVGGSAIFNFTDEGTADLWPGLNVLEVDENGHFLRQTSGGGIQLNRASYLNLEQNTLSTNLLTAVSPKMSLTHSGKLVFTGTMEEPLDFGNGLVLSPKYEEGTSGYAIILDTQTFTWEHGFSTYDMNFLVNRRNIHSVLPPMTLDQEELIIAHSWRSFGLETDNLVEVGVNSYAQKRGSILAKYDFAGNNLWNNYSLTPSVRSITMQADGDILTYGQFTNFLSIGDSDSEVYGTNTNGQQDIFLATFDKDGQHQWATVLGSSEEDKAGILIGGCEGLSHFSDFGINPIIDENGYNKNAVKAIFPFAPNGDCETTTCSAIVSTSTLNAVSSVEIVLTPNPAHDFTNLQIKQQDASEELACYLYNLSGQLMERYTFQTNENLEINTRQFVEGIYFYKIQQRNTGTVIGQGKLIKQ